MTVTRAVPFSRQSAGATAARTPSTVANVLATAAGSPARTSASKGESGPVPIPERVEVVERDAGRARAVRASSRAGSRTGSSMRQRRAHRGSQARPSAAIQRWRTTSRAQEDQARLGRASRWLRGQSTFGPTVASTTGSSVTATATLTSAIRSPAIPMLRRAGIGTASSASSEMPTVVPLKTTAEPACCIAFSTAWSFVMPGCCRSSLQRTTISSA